MAPTPQELRKGLGVKESCDVAPDRIVISGMSGLYPNMHNVKEFKDTLYNKKNPFDQPMPDWKKSSLDHPEFPETTGTIPNAELFDAQFFKVHYHLAMNMDPMGRKLLEQAYQAVYDAGISPKELNGKKIGVYTATAATETEKIAFYGSEYHNGLGIAGCSKTMFANRISYSMNLKGPSMAIDGACNSAHIALEMAFQDMTSGECEGAIVGGSSLCRHPQTVIHFGRVTPISMDGKVRSFDKNANGTVRAEAINVIFLQRASDAKRIYAEVLGVKTEFRGLETGDTGPKFGFYRDPVDSADFLQKFYKDINVPPQAVEYVEAMGSADPEADKAELETLEKVFCKDRDEPLMVGSVMSNIGYTEAAHGISALTKILLGYQSGRLAANLNYEDPRDDIQALKDGRMEILSDHKPFRGTYVGLNSVNLMGINSHVLLHGYNKPKDPNRYKTSLPRLVFISARQDKTVKKIFEDLESRPVDPEEIALLNNIHEKKILGHLGRGYCVLDTNEEGNTVCLSKKEDYFNEETRPLWFMYSGMGSQWPGMGGQLMRIPVFAAAIERCQKALAPKGIDILHIITTPNVDIFDNILHCFVGIAAIQIGLTDVLKSVGIVPDMIIGHSGGELGCSYADGSFTAEEMILCAYSRGVVSLQTPLIRGSMAAVGMGFEQISKLLPPEIEVACHNASDSSTISGPADKMKEFVAELTAKGIFAKEVPCSNIAYHSKYISDAGPDHLKYLKEVIKNPRPRSKRWVSSSLPQSKWNDPIAQMSSAEYHTYNFLNPVLFEETSRLIPANAVVVEIAPHGLLQAIVKRSLPSCKHIPLTRRGHKDNAFTVIDAIGKLYMEGFNPKISELYPKIEFPVSTGTPMLSHLVEWVHTENWMVCLYNAEQRKPATACNFFVSLYEEEYMNLAGNIIQDKILYPFSAALVAAWDTLAMSLDQPRREFPVEFSDIHLYTQPKMLKQRPLKIQVSLTKGNGNFEVSNDNSLIVSGRVVPLKHDITARPFSTAEKHESLDVTSDDIYQIFYERDYNYQGDFRSLLRTNTSVTEAKVIWNNDWVTFLDGILQLIALRSDYNHVSQPCEIRRMCIDTNFHKTKDEVLEDMTVRTATICSLTSAVRCGGVLLEDIKTKDLLFIENESITLMSLTIPNIKVKAQTGAQPTLAHGATLSIGQVGDLDSLQWVTTVQPTRPGIEVKVHYAAINDIDVKRATGVIPFKTNIEAESSFGMDFSGVTVSGKRVMGVLPSGSMSEQVKAIPEALWPVPDYWSLEDAATVPSAYMLAFYCLALKAKLYAGTKILVHGGAGALGQAVISIALAHKAEVFTTVSDVRKKEFLLKLFPDLKEDHIGNSRNNSFADMIRSASEGVDFIISCSKKDLKDTSIACGNRLSILLDLVQIPLNEHYNFGMANLDKDKNYIPVDFSSIFASENQCDLKIFQQLVFKGILEGFVRPLSRVTYAPEEVPRAFRLLAASRHRGRVLIKMDDADTPAKPRFTCTPEKTQVVICNDDSLGPQWTDHLIIRGARNVLLHCSFVPAYLLVKIKSWQKHGVNVRISSEDLSTVAGVTAFINESKHLGIVEGIYVIATNRQLDVKEINNVVANLDAVGKKLSPLLKYFTVLNAGTNIGLDTCISRVNSGLPATLLDISGNKNAGTNSIGKHNIPSLHGILVAFEQALMTSQPVVVADSQELPKQTLLQQIERIAELNIFENTDPKTSLTDLGLKPEKIPTLMLFLSDQHHIHLPNEVIANLTIEKIREIEENLREPQLKDARGLDVYFSSVNKDELLVTAEMIFMKTLTSTSEGCGEYFENNQEYMCVVPGLEGQLDRFSDFCQLLKLPALVLQPGLDRLKETLGERAQRFVKTLIHKTKKVNNKFYLLGYETGILVALEMAAILEKQGMTGTVYCIGGTPEEILSMLENHTSEYSTTELQTKIGRHMCSLIAGEDVDLGDIDEAKEGESWLAPWTRALLGKVTCSTQYTRAIIEGAYEMISSARAYVPNLSPLRSRLVVIRASDVGLGTPPYVLMQRYSQQPVEVVTVPTPLAHLMKDLRCAAIVNKNLEPETLESYNQRNLCVTYADRSTMFVAK